MRNGSQSADRMPVGRSVSGSPGGLRPGRERSLSPEDLDHVFATVGQNLRDGKSSKAEKLLVDTIENYSHTAENLANLKRLLAFTFETVGNYKDSLDAVRVYESEDMREQISKETQVRVTTQLAVAYNNLGDHPKAVTLLKEVLEVAKENDLSQRLGPIDSGLARVYRKLNECAICRDYAGKSLAYFRESGDWLGMSEAYREIALSYHQEGNSEKSLEYFDLGIQIIGDRSAPFMLGKLYTDMSGAYWFLRRPKDGIACLEKSIGFFEQTEHVLNSIIAYNNLGINLMLVGEWERAEEIIKRALDLAIDSNHVHIAGILDSLGELKILRDDLTDAEDYLDQAIALAKERNREWYAAQAMRNLARCYLAQGKTEAAIAKAKETIELCGQIGDKHYANMAGLVLAESHLGAGDPNECEATLKSIEENDPTADFYVLGNIQRIRGMAELENDQVEVAVHHFNRSLTIFEAAEDLYHRALAELLIGENVGPENVGRAKRHLAKAGDIFRRLGVTRLAERAAKKLESLKDLTSGEMRAPGHSNSAASQLLMVRLAEATASRELLFRELVAVLQQESRAKKIIIAEPDDDKKLRPFITHGYSPVESNELVGKFEDVANKGTEKAFARIRNLSVFALKTVNAKPAYLLIQPSTSAILNDGSPLTPLLPVVELGLDVIALRERDKRTPVEQESSPYTSSSLMPGFIHSSPAMTSLVEEVYKIRSSDVTVLVTGESGTGKELVSRPFRRN